MRIGKYERLAADIFGYTYDNYLGHLQIGNERYESLMPRDAKLLEKAVVERWSILRISEKLEVDVEQAGKLLVLTKDALERYEAANPAEFFRVAVRQMVEEAVSEGLSDEKDVNELVSQICHVASDMAVLLKAEKSEMVEYSGELRRPAGEV
ncbi:MULTISPECIES: hypothetical protein [Pirellulaceae]|uniref:Uncharacterized protein n=1 Tax=Aporhodopirellula rubra TaxID=980271 RepID=A0A7W5E468_9BACT|nr:MULTISPECIES: hypothetical protein [Pirellulaceae]EMI42320.1 hypothetical protein RRSWK_05163 [Rhodopirellula sp. SWK7]MBB3209263.1 hypothetical protein [Aporhodopirellula rubra]